MRLITIDCIYFSYKPTIKTLHENYTFKDDSIRNENYYNCLVANIAIERGDNNIKIVKSSKEIISISRELDVSCIVLVPNVHLTNKPIEHEKAINLFLFLFDTIKNKSIIPVYLEAFGYTGEWQIHAKGHIKSVLGRTY